MSTLRFNNGHQDPSPTALSQEAVFRKAIAKYIRKLELMIESGAPASHVDKAVKTYGIEWAYLSDSIKAHLKEFAPVEAQAEVEVPKRSKKTKEEPSSEQAPE